MTRPPPDRPGGGITWEGENRELMASTTRSFLSGELGKHLSRGRLISGDDLGKEKLGWRASVIQARRVSLTRRRWRGREKGQGMTKISQKRGKKQVWAGADEEILN